MTRSEYPRLELGKGLDRASGFRPVQVVYQVGPATAGRPLSSPPTEFRSTVTTASPVINTPSVARKYAA
jgi:hypothetical protein